MAAAQPQQGEPEGAVRQGRQQAAFPPPPPYYRLFRDCATGAERQRAGVDGPAETSQASADAIQPGVATASAVGASSAAAGAAAADAEAPPEAAATAGPAQAGAAASAREDAEGGQAPSQHLEAGGGLPFPLRPPPLPGCDAHFQMFGELHTVGVVALP